MKSESWLRGAVRIGSAAALIVLGSMGLRAEDGGGNPGRAVRLSSVDGQVQVAQNGEVLADHALANTPLFEGMAVSTGDDGRAEIQFEDGSVARIPPDSSLTLTVLRPGDTELSLESGMGYFELQDGSQGTPTRVRFGDNVVTVSGFTVLRVRLDEAPGELAVFSGNAHIDGVGGTSMDVRGGESVSLNNLNLAQTIEPDSWDSWNADRDQAVTTSEVGETPATSNLPDSGNPAWGDLNVSGSWYNVPDQGYVWSPYEASDPGWDPYGMGYWMWTPGYGYVWVSGYSWGYMPYQCGAWNWYNAFGWGWAPGPCNTWWGGGVWLFNVGYMPRWYRLPIRPHPRPVGPDRLTEGPKVRLPIAQRPRIPIISVVRNEPNNGVPALPPRSGSHPIQIGGVVAEPLKPTVQPRAGMHRIPDTMRPGAGNPERTFNTGGSTVGRPIEPRHGYVPAPAPGVPVQRPGYTPAPPQPGGRTTIPASPSSPRTPSVPVYRPAPMPAPAPAPRPSGGGSVPRSAPAPAPRPAPAPAPHPSGGGGRPAGPH